MAYWCANGAFVVIIYLCFFNSAQSNDQVITERALDNKLPTLQLSSYVQREKYQSLMDVQQRNVTDKGMDIVYTAVNWFIFKLSREFRHYYLLTNNALIDRQKFLQSLKENYVQWIQFDQGFLVTGAICLLLTALFTVIYLFYLCCRCCCCRRSTDKPNADLKNDICRRRAYTCILTVIVVINIFAVACVFITNEYTHEAVQQLPNRIQHGIYDLSLYREDTNKRIRKLLIDDYRVLNETMIIAVNQASSVIVERVKQVSGAESLDELAAIGERATYLEVMLDGYEIKLIQFEKEVVRLRHNLTRLRNSAQTELTACIQSTTNPYQESCQKAQRALEKYDSLPEKLTDLASFSQIKENLNSVAAYNISALLYDGRRHFEDMEIKFMREINSKRDQIRKWLDEMGIDLKKTANSIEDRLDEFDTSKPLTLLQEYEHYLREYEEQFRWVGGLIIGGLLAIMVLCFGLGLFYGCCGKRPSYYEDDCCVRSTGAKLFCAGSFFGIFFIFLFMVISVSLFMIGGNFQGLVCDALQRPTERTDVVSFAQRYVNVLRENNAWFRREFADGLELMQESNITSIIQGCNNDLTLYTIFDLDDKYRLKDLREAKNEAYRELDRQIESLIRGLKVEGNLPDLLSPEIEAKINKLKEVGISGIPPRLLTQLRSQIDAFDITQQTSIIEAELSRHQNRDVAGIKKILADVKKLDKESAEPLRRNLTELVNNLTALNDRLPNLTEEIPNLLLVLKHAQALLSTNLTGQVNSVALQVSKRFKSYVDQYMDHVENSLATSISSCTPLKQIGAAAVDAVCVATVNPFNGFWASVGICLLLTIPTIMLATCLRDLYRNTEPYSGTDYMSHCSNSTTPRHRRVSAFMTDTYDHTYRRLNGTTPKRDSNGYGNWRTPSSSSTTCFEDLSPPPPYSNSKRHS